MGVKPALSALAVVATVIFGSLVASNAPQVQRAPSAADSVVAGSAGAAAAFPEAVLRPSFINLDRPPSYPWQLNRCETTSPLPTARHQNGILTLTSAGPCIEYELVGPAGIWNTWASNARGWVVEASLRVDPSSTGSCPARSGANLSIQDDVQRIRVGVSAQAVCIFDPEAITVLRNTTVGFHVYRVEGRGRCARIYVDGRMAMNFVIDGFPIRSPSNGIRGLTFGDTWDYSPVYRRSYWDYVAYDTTPGFNPAHWLGCEWPPDWQPGRR